jgi:hypothetical protein
VTSLTKILFNWSFCLQYWNRNFTTERFASAYDNELHTWKVKIVVCELHTILNSSYYPTSPNNSKKAKLLIFKVNSVQSDFNFPRRVMYLKQVRWDKCESENFSVLVRALNLFYLEEITFFWQHKKICHNQKYLTYKFFRTYSNTSPKYRKIQVSCLTKQQTTPFLQKHNLRENSNLV